jgi:hypothetical protein
MKKHFLFIALAFLIFSCNKSEMEDLNNNVKALQDSLNVTNNLYLFKLDSLIKLQNTIIASDSVDLKALKMDMAGILFTAMAMQPEIYKSMIKAMKMSYSSYQELLPISDKNLYDRGRARGEAFGRMFEAVARQPEMSAQIDSVADIFLGKYDPSYISGELLNHTRNFASVYLIEAMSRQPEADSAFNALSKKYLNYALNE